MNKFILLSSLILLTFACGEADSTEETTNLEDDFEPKIISSEANEVPLNEANEIAPALVLTDLINGEISTELPNSFKLRGISPQNPVAGVKESKLHEYVEQGNGEITFFFIKTIYESKDQSIDSHHDGIINSPRANSDRKFLKKIIINETTWLYEQYEMNDPDGTPVMYDDFIYINKDIMYGMTVCCNSVSYAKWESVIVNAKEKLTIK